MTNKATTLEERYEALRGDILCPTSTKKGDQFDLELMLSGGMSALISGAFPLPSQESRAKMDFVEGFAGIPRIIGQMVMASMIEQYGI